MKASRCRGVWRLLAWGLLAWSGTNGVVAEAAPGIQQEVQTCVACHSQSVLKSAAVVPNIWGQNEGYIYLQLRDFKSGARAAPTDVPMHGVASTLSDEQMQAIAKYVSGQPWPKLDSVATDKALLKRGSEVLAAGGCSGCHFNDWRGYSANPHIGGQSPTYLATTIRQFRSGARANAPGMSDMMNAIGEGDIDAVAAYLGSVK